MEFSTSRSSLDTAGFSSPRDGGYHVAFKISFTFYAALNILRLAAATIFGLTGTLTIGREIAVIVSFSDDLPFTFVNVLAILRLFLTGGISSISDASNLIISAWKALLSGFFLGNIKTGTGFAFALEALVLAIFFGSCNGETSSLVSARLALRILKVESG